MRRHPEDVEPGLRRLIEEIYASFNERDIDRVLHSMRPDVVWPNGMEGGYVHGRDDVRAYWTRQWRLIDPAVEPLALSREPDGRVAVRVHQVVRDLKGVVLHDGIVRHVYTFRDGLIESMELQEAT